MSGTRHSLPAPDVVLVIGSHGALDASKVLLTCLPAGFPATIVLDLHGNGTRGLMHRLLARDTKLSVREATSGASLEPGTIFLAPYHSDLLMSEAGFVGMAGTGYLRWNRFTDILLCSAADAFGSRLIAVVLSGYLDGGALGVRAVKTRGGRVLVQDPASAAAKAMPFAAIATGCTDFVMAPRTLGDALVALCAAPGAAELFRVHTPPPVKFPSNARLSN